MRPDDPRHGSEAGNEQHLRDGEQPCNACRQADILANRRRSKRKAMGYHYTRPVGVPLLAKLATLRARGATYEDIADWAGVSPSQVWRVCTGDPRNRIYTRTWLRLDDMRPPEQIITLEGITRRLRALQWLGYSAPAIAAEAGVHRDTIADAIREPRIVQHHVREAIAAAYDRLSMRPAEGGTQQEKAGVSRARNTARANNWAPPLAWDDIDDPAEHPKVGHAADASRHRDELDEAVIVRVLAGEHLPTTAAEKAEILRRWAATGRSATTFAEQRGWKADRYWSAA